LRYDYKDFICKKKKKTCYMQESKSLVEYESS